VVWGGGGGGKVSNPSSSHQLSPLREGRKKGGKEPADAIANFKRKRMHGEGVKKKTELGLSSLFCSIPEERAEGKKKKKRDEESPLGIKRGEEAGKGEGRKKPALTDSCSAKKKEKARRC